MNSKTNCERAAEKAEIALKEFVSRELELKQTLTFGQWLRHIRESHEQLCQMVLAGHRVDRLLHVEVMRDDPDGNGMQVSTFKIPGDCDRVLVDAVRISVRGFRQIANQNGVGPLHGELLSQCVMVLVGGDGIVLAPPRE